MSVKPCALLGSLLDAYLSISWAFLGVIAASAQSHSEGFKVQYHLQLSYTGPSPPPYQGASESQCTYTALSRSARKCTFGSVVPHGQTGMTRNSLQCYRFTTIRQLRLPNSPRQV
ncbi:hypothetical protein F4604DRAFT_539627 [Suillus subluteus]|nr:hypothetical protein F4604DRAFT_209788 [Suillus subluteus]KAG1879933.1 hypothetical protein F4604DRAFT_539627 [Suillus subluteus]